MPIEWGVAERRLPGESVSGDLYVVAPLPDGALIAVIDGLGHGRDAANAADLAAASLRERPEETLDSLFERCHQRLRSGRGVVMSTATLNDRIGTMTWAGVGNVMGYLLRAQPDATPPRESLLLRNGLVGLQLPSIRIATLRLSPGDTLIFATDGVATNFLDEYRVSGRPQDVANDVLRRYAKMSDDALVLVATYQGAVS